MLLNPESRRRPLCRQVSRRCVVSTPSHVGVERPRGHRRIYYHVDNIQRYIRDALGIPNVMNWSIEADHHTVGSAFYSPSGKFLGFGDSGPNRPDRGEDGDVMAHEYGHAIHDDMVPGWGVFNSTTSRHEARAMGEGFGDALACILHQEGGGLFQPEVFEDWILAPAGLRRVDGVKQYPGEGTTGTTGDWVNQVHSDGEIWSATLWSAYLAAGGTARALRLAPRRAKSSCTRSSSTTFA